MEPKEIGLITTMTEGVEETAATIKKLGLKNIQYLVMPDDDMSDDTVANIRRAFVDEGINITLLFCFYRGMDYSTLEMGVQTGGLVPALSRWERLDWTKKVADFARALGASAACSHYGEIPEVRDTDDYRDLIHVTQDLCDHCKSLGLTFNLETGEDSTETIHHFLSDVNRDNLGINFDPANMILYGKSEPIKALRDVADHVLSVHVKDGKWSGNPGVEWGSEVPLGEGEVDIEAFVRTLHEIGYTGPLTIEREVEGEERIRDVGAGIKLLEDIKSKL
jgi:sugar phosphate isomerase/epimerase